MYTALHEQSLLRLHATHRDASPLVCIPGAGASVTAFVDFVGFLDDGWPVYGLQPRGLDISESPHETIEDQAAYNLDTIALLASRRPIHLLGHSHGGLVAYEMAVRLCQQGQSPLSLTVIDSDPPHSCAPDDTHDRSKVFKEFAVALEGNYGRALQISSYLFDEPRLESFLEGLHSALVRARCISSRTKWNVLQGSFATFAAAIRCSYNPTNHYPGELDLVLASSQPRTSPSLERSTSLREEWGVVAATLDVLIAPGDHYSMLRAPHVGAIAKWWREKRA